MNRLPVCVCVAAMMLVACASQVKAQPKIEWAPGFPKTGTANKSMQFKGKIHLPKGNWKVLGVEAAIQYWKQGERVKFDNKITYALMTPITANGKTVGYEFESDVYFPESGQMYWVFIESRVETTGGTEQHTIRSAPAYVNSK